MHTKCILVLDLLGTDTQSPFKQQSQMLVKCKEDGAAPFIPVGACSEHFPTVSPWT